MDNQREKLSNERFLELVGIMDKRIHTAAEFYNYSTEFYNSRKRL